MKSHRSPKSFERRGTGHMKKGSAIMRTFPIRAFEQDILRILLKSHPERIARVASVALFWCQLAQHRHHGKLGIFKTDSDLSEEIGRHGKTAGKNLMEVCTPLGQQNRTALFEVTYGPKAGQDCGRCRWLFLTPRGEQIIQLAREDRAMRDEVKRSRRGHRQGIHETVNPPFSDNGTRRSAPAVRHDRGPQNTPTLFTEDSSLTTSRNLSSARRREIPTENSQARQEEEERKISRIPELWKLACERCARPDLLWRPSEVRTFAAQFSEIESMRTVRDLSDEKLLERLILLCGDLDRVFPDMSEPFCDFNKKGLKAQSFAKYGDKLLELAEAKLSTKGIDTKSMEKLSDL
jgi:hypothetical protein